MSDATFGATEDIDLLVASHVFAHNARPLFAVLDDAAQRVARRAGGGDFPELLEGPGQDSLELADVLAAVGVAGADIVDVTQSLLAVDPGTAAGFPRRLTTAGGRSLGLVYVRRPAPDGRIQFSLIDITAFVAAERRGREMAVRILDALERGDVSALSALDVVTDGVGGLATLPDDDAVATVARQLAETVERVIGTSIAILRVFEADGIEPPASSADAVPRRTWSEVWDDARSGRIPTHSLRDAREFVRHAIPTFLISPRGREVIGLNRALDGCRLSGIEALVRSLGVEDNSIGTAADFFSGLRTERGVATFSMQDTTIEARGLPLGGGDGSLPDDHRRRRRQGRDSRQAPPDPACPGNPPIRCGLDDTPGWHRQRAPERSQGGRSLHRWPAYHRSRPRRPRDSGTRRHETGRMRRIRTSLQLIARLLRATPALRQPPAPAHRAPRRPRPSRNRPRSAPWCW